MDTEHPGRDWRSILLLIFSLGAAALAFTAALTAFLIATVDQAGSSGVSRAGPAALAPTLLASSLVFIGLLLLPVAGLSWQRLRGRQPEPFSLSPLRAWIWFAILSLWLLALVGATFLFESPGAGWYIPFFHFLSIALPVFVTIHIGIRTIPLGSRLRAWGVFSAGMVLSPAVAIIVETAFFVLGAVLFVGYLALTLQDPLELQSLAAQIENAPDIDSLLPLLEPLLTHPLTLLAALFFLSVLIPVVEELAKTIGVWLVADRLTSPAQGFALGLLSGAGFALAESLFICVTPDQTWAVTLSMRAVSGSMHMLASGLAGWGLASARLEKRWLRMVLLTLLAILLHGIWNAGAVLAVAGGVRAMFAQSGLDILGSLLAAGGLGLILLSFAGIFTTLVLLNLKFRNPSIPQPASPPPTLG